MLIHSLRLENIKSYSNVTFHFTPGVNAIVGHNGAGKSTIVEAIGFALFDAGKGPALLRQGAAGGQIVVGIESTLDERRYDVVRRLKETWYVHDVELSARIVSGADDVLAFLREHLGIERGANLERIFDDAVGVAQGALTAAFLRTPAQRKVVFDPLLGVDEYERAVSNLLDTKNLIRDNKNDIDTRLARVEGVLEQLPTVVAALGAASEAVRQGDASLIAIDAQLALAQQERAAWDVKRAALLAAQQRLASAQAAHERSLLLLGTAQQALSDAESAAQIVAENQAGHDAHLANRSRRATLEEMVNEGRRLQVERAKLAAQGEQFRLAAERAQSELERISQIEMGLPALRQASERERELQQALEQARGAAQQHTQLAGKKAQLELSLRDESERLEELRTRAISGVALQGELTASAAQEAEIAKQIESAIRAMSENRARGEGINEQNNALADAAGALCPVCEQPLTPQHRAELHSRNDLRLAELRNAWSAQKTDKVRLEAEREALVTHRATLSAQIAQMPNAAQVEQAERWCADLSRQLAETVDLLQDAASGVDTIAQLEAEIRALDEPRVKLGVANQIVATAGVQMDSLRENSLGVERIGAQLANIDAQLSTLEATTSELEEVKRAEIETQPAWQQVIGAQIAASQRDARAAEVANAQTATVNARASLEEATLADEAAALDFDETRAEAARQSEALAQVEAGTLRNTLAMQRSEVERLTRQQEALRQQEREATILRAQVDQVRRQQEVIDMMRGTLKQAGPLVTRAMITRVSAYAAQWFGELTGDFSRRLIWDEEYAILLEQGGRKLEFKSMSGGEQMAAALSVRLALLRELGSIDIAFFDEPTAHLDAERRETLAEQIKSVRGFRQLFVISHDDTFENKTDNVIKVEKSGGASRIVSET